VNRRFDDLQPAVDFRAGERCVIGGRVLFMFKLAVSLRQCKIHAPKLLMRQAIGVSLNRESVRTPEVDMTVSNRSDASQGVDGIPGRRTLTFAFNASTDSDTAGHQ
jgi:hypothetical protein